MSRVLAYTTPARGHLYPLTAILLALRERGHEVSVRTLASELPMLRALGFDAEAIDPALEAMPIEDWRERSPQKGLRRTVDTFAARARFDAPDLQRAIEDTAPDLVVVDVNAWGAMATAERWGGPWAVFAPYPLALESRDAPPFGPGFAPATSWLGRGRDRLARPLVKGALDRIMTPPMNDLRTSMGLPAVGRYDDVLTAAPLVLSMTAEPFEYPRSDWPASVVQVGACAWDPPSGDLPAWVAELDGPVVLVTTSSEFQDDGRLVDAALEALADDPVTVVATLPAAQTQHRSVPANAHIAPFVPHGALLGRTAVAVTHGGMGATQKALARGVPVCAVPFGRDQFEVARRVAVAGAGTRLPARRLTPERLRAAVLAARECRPGAERVAEGFRRAGGPAAAADALESRLLPVA